MSLHVRHPSFIIRLLFAIALMGSAAVVGACDFNAGPLTSGENSPAPTPSAGTRAPQQTPLPTFAASAATPGPINLVVWMSDEFASAPAPEGSNVFTTQVAGFEAAFPDTHVSIQPKKPYGI
ncbi:MAG: hypothetical protein LC737_08295 [Chloroflexi bacterium]|nr:hypothetical protein [Chloroflexota bacterium]